MILLQARCWTRFHCFCDRFVALNSPAGGFRCCGLWVSNVAGVKTSGVSASLETGTSGLALTIGDTSAIRVVKTSCVRCFGERSATVASNTHLATPIILSHAPPVCKAWGGLNSHSQPSFSRYFLTGLASEGFSTAWSLLHAPTKLVPQSERGWMTGPLMARNLRSASIKLEVSVDSMTSMCTARVFFSYSPQAVGEVSCLR